MSKTSKVMGLTAIGMGKAAIKLGQMALGKNAKKEEEAPVIPVSPPAQPTLPVLPQKAPSPAPLQAPPALKPEQPAKKPEEKRDYKKEAEAEKARYKQFSVKIDREFGEAFAAKLTEKNISLVDWFRDCAKQFMED